MDRQECLSSTGVELRAVWNRELPLSRLTVEAGVLSDDLLFASAAFSTRQTFGRSRVEEALRVHVDDEHYRAVASAAFNSGSMRVAARYQHDGGGVALGGLASSILPRSAYAHHVLDPALPVALLAGDDYDGWRIESTVPLLPFTAFYQRHELGDARLSLTGLQVDLGTDPMPILNFPGLHVTAGVARVLDAPLGTGVNGDTKWWIGMRWRP